MKNYIQRGKEITVAAPAALVSGAAFIVGKLFLVAAKSVGSGESVVGSMEGVFSLPKLSADVDAVGDKVNWNNTLKVLQKATSDLDNVATVVEAAGATVLFVKVKLTPV